MLPALPAEWASGSVKGLRARGGFTIDMSWDGGAVSNLTISSERGGETDVVLPSGDVVNVVLGPNESKKLL